MLERLRQMVGGWFDALDAMQAQLSERWSRGNNIRTVVIVCVVGLIATYTYTHLIRPPDAFPAGHLVSVPAGASLAQIGDTLQEQRVVQSSFAFRLTAIMLGKWRHLRAGDYVFKTPRNVVSVVRALAIGAYGLEPIAIRIPEGATTRQMAVIYGAQLERFNQARFLEKAQPLEGYLFPDTYFFLPNATEDTVIKTMRQNFDEKIATIQSEIDASGHSLNEIVIMASILEREGNGTDDDRRMIAGVLWNRIAKDMALQVDAVFLYTMGKATFDLTRQDLRNDSAYNTYTHKGLPPTPIGSPSLDSLLAAATPIKSSYLFYLADAYGVTHYSRTYQQHLEKKSIYIDE